MTEIEKLKNRIAEIKNELSKLTYDLQKAEECYIKPLPLKEREAIPLINSCKEYVKEYIENDEISDHLEVAIFDNALKYVYGEDICERLTRIKSNG